MCWTNKLAALIYRMTCIKDIFSCMFIYSSNYTLKYESKISSPCQMYALLPDDPYHSNSIMLTRDQKGGRHMYNNDRLSSKGVKG